MSLAQFFIELRCPDLNEMLAAAHGVYRLPRGGTVHSSKYAQLKKKYSADVGQLIRGYYRRLGIVPPAIPKDQRVAIRFDWYEGDRRRDPDNLAGGGRKIILDAAQAIGLLPHDGWRLYREDAIAIEECFHVANTPTQKIGVLVTIRAA